MTHESSPGKSAAEIAANAIARAVVSTKKIPMTKPLSAQTLCHELFEAVEGPLGEAWISDEPGTDDPREFLRFVRAHLAALDDARGVIKAFLKKHRA